MEEGDLTAAQVAEVLNLPDDVDPLTFNPFAAGVDAADALAVEKVSQQIMTAVSSFSSAAEGAGASKADAFSAALGSVIEVVKVKAENLSDENASVAAKTLDFSNAADLNLIKTKVTGKTANLAGIDADAVAALIDDTATSIKNVNDEIAKVTDLTSDATQAAFSTMQTLIEEVKEAAKAEANLAGSGNITYTDTSVVAAAAKNKAPSDIALSATSISEGASSLIIGTASTTDSDQTGGVAFKYSLVAADGTDHAAFTINAETGELSLKEQPDYETKSSYKVIIKSTDEGRKSYQEKFEITVGNINEDPYFSSFVSDGVIEDSKLEVSGTVEAFDPDGAKIDYSISSKDIDVALSNGVYSATSAFGTLILNKETGSYTYSLNNSSEAVQSLSSSDNFSDVFRLTAFDGSKSVSKNLTFTVAGANDEPEAPTLTLKNDLSAYVSGTVIGQLNSLDPEKNEITFSIGEEKNGSLFEIDGSNLKIKNDLEDGTYSLNVTANDGFGGTSTSPFTITVDTKAVDVGANVAPMFSSAKSLQVTKGKEYSSVISVSDLNEGDALSVTAGELPSWLSFNSETLTLSGTPTGSDLGTNSFTLQVSDGVLSTAQTFSMTVNNTIGQIVVLVDQFSDRIFDLGHENLMLFDYGGFSQIRMFDYESNGLTGYDNFEYIDLDTVGSFYMHTPDKETSPYSSFNAASTNDYDYDFISTGYATDPFLGGYYYDDYYVFQRADQLSDAEVNHGDWALAAFLQELDDPDRTAIIAIDLDTLNGPNSHYSKLFGLETYYMPGSGMVTATAGENILDKWLSVNDYRVTGNPEHSDYSLAAVSVSIAGGPATSETLTLKQLESLDVPIIQSAPNVSQGIYDWGSNYPDVINVGAWNDDANGNLLISSEETFGTVDILANGLVTKEGWGSNFGTSFATPRVAAEVTNLLNKAIKSFETEGLSLDKLQEESAAIDIDYSDIVGFFIDAIGTPTSFQINNNGKISNHVEPILTIDIEKALDPVEVDIALSDETAWGTIDGIEIV